MTLDGSSTLPRTVLITQAHLARYAGSEMVTIELAEHFASHGVSVSVLTHVVSDQIRTELEAAGVTVVLTDDRGEPDSGSTERPDLVWVHHGLVPSSLVADPAGTRFVFNHMSASHPLEFDLTDGIEDALSSVSTYDAAETLLVQESAGLVPPEDERRSVFANPAPDAFARAGAPSADGPVLVVSNHPPVELDEALSSLGSMKVVRVGDGGEGYEARRITPDVLAEASAVVTIGKTVQYALASNVPVYCYDVHGGPGWLTAANVKAAAEVNFSGRGTRRRSADEIRSEIEHGRPVPDDVVLMGDALRPELMLGPVIAKLLRQVEAAPAASGVSQRQVETHARRLELQRRNTIAAQRWQTERQRTRDRIGELISAVAERDERLHGAGAAGTGPAKFESGGAVSMQASEREASRARITELRSVIAARDERLRAVLKENADLRNAGSGASGELARVKKEAAVTEDRRQHLEEARDTAASRARAAEKELLAIERSFAYQLTAPLRRFEARRREGASE
ncbi:hypothetical protein [Frigoribacterium sp. PvP032]|uniref:hypothetical protein n=1 Tax=Frigoribacterium sp. PvP032 TaxID=2806589 RepID=UPI001AE4B216|nr:hypothetical protein [Frigoribacterium sp. PvP032]MBP1190240.1 hypothetical protein [Frigoribacterium sp. PvP032]